MSSVAHQGIVLQEAGFVRFHLLDHLTDVERAESVSALQGEFVDLPVDPYGEDANRYRRYARAVLTPWNGALAWIPGLRDERGEVIAEYFQGAYNPDFEGTSRRFPALSEGARANPLLQRIIRFDFEQTFWAEAETLVPVHVGVHLVKLLVARDGERAVSSPDCLHRDGEAFTFAHLMRRRNVVGGVNTIAAVHCAGLEPDDIADRLVLARFELTEPLESYAVCDAKVSHHVSSIRRGPGPGPGERSVLLIDFTPMAPQLGAPQGRRPTRQERLA